MCCKDEHSTSIPAKCCAVPYTLSGGLYRNCTINMAVSNQFGCYNSYGHWVKCQQPHGAFFCVIGWFITLKYLGCFLGGIASQQHYRPPGTAVYWEPGPINSAVCTNCLFHFITLCSLLSILNRLTMRSRNKTFERWDFSNDTRILH